MIGAPSAPYDTGALLAIAVLAGGAAWLWYQFLMPPLKAANAVFVVEPYLQLGEHGDVHTPDILFATTDSPAQWKVEAQLKDGSWKMTRAISFDHHAVNP